MTSQFYSDVLTMVVLGGGMWFLQRYGFSAGPLVLGIVLGPIAESNFVEGRIIAGAEDGMAVYFLSGGLNIALISIIVLSVISSIILTTRSKRKVATSASTLAANASDEKDSTKRN